LLETNTKQLWCMQGHIRGGWVGDIAEPWRHSSVPIPRVSWCSSSSRREGRKAYTVLPLS
jgi:hypothetical protein